MTLLREMDSEPVIVEIDPQSGYCFGVEYAIQMAEQSLTDEEGGPAPAPLYCLGDIVHNDREVSRLAALGLEVIDHDRLATLRDARVLIRAHGEPPSTYQLALERNLELIDASCPVVLKLQNRVRHSYERITPRQGQIVLYGQPGHAEVRGIAGQTAGEAIVVRTTEDLAQIDFTRPIALYSQTTKSTAGFYALRDQIADRVRAAGHDPEDTAWLEVNDSICRQVSNREPALERFARAYDIILFVSGAKSSNGRALYQVCRAINERAYFIEGPEQIDPAWIDEARATLLPGTPLRIGIAGATSTPQWLMEQVADACRAGLTTVPVAATV